MSTTIPDENVIRMAVDLAGRAPSVHNSQPWRWTYADGQLELYAEHSRLLPEADPTSRQLVVSCGATLHHLETALTTLRWASDVVHVPDGTPSRHLATVRFHRDAQPRSHDFDLLTAIRHRFSDRRPFGALAADRALPASLRDMVGRRAVQLTVVPADARPTLAAATAATAALRRYDSAYQAELRWWTGHSIDSTGIPPAALATEENRSRVDIGRTFPAGEDVDSAEEVDRSTVLVLSTETDGQLDWLRAGEALSMVLLEATVDELATCPLTHVTELRQSREMIRELLPERGYPQVLVRVGITAKTVPPRQTPRRPTDTVLSVVRGRENR